ncbi:MAG TPA: DUF3108 domain-containing protein [Gemmatimonadales bacterium]|nr:DUF3108 domain-containing protein [Gemmatimonadales bacterium]
MIQLIAHAGLLARLAAPTPYPFAVGETLRYDAKLGYLPVGTASVSVTRLVQERGAEAFEFTATGEGGPPGWRVRYDMDSRVGTADFNSLRFHRRLEQGGKVDEHAYVIVPDSARYREEGVPGEWVAPADPLDDLAFLYYLRAAPLKVGRTYVLERYFKTGYNPIEVRVSGREPVPMPGGGSASCLAVQVTARGTTMRVWFTDDKRRLPAQMEIPLPFGSVTLSLAGQTGSGAAGQ